MTIDIDDVELGSTRFIVRAAKEKTDLVCQTCNGHKLATVTIGDSSKACDCPTCDGRGVVERDDVKYKVEAVKVEHLDSIYFDSPSWRHTQRCMVIVSESSGEYLRVDLADTFDNHEAARASAEKKQAALSATPKTLSGHTSFVQRVTYHMRQVEALNFELDKHKAALDATNKKLANKKKGAKK